MSTRKQSWPFILVVLVGCQFHASCGSKRLDMEKARSFVSSFLEQQAGQKPTSVTCPDSVAPKKGATFECTARFDAATATVTLGQTDDKGGVTVASVTGILIASKLEAQVAQTLGAKLGDQLKISCGPRVRSSTAGDRFTCDAKNAAGATGIVTVIVKDNSGNVGFELGDTTRR